MKTGHVCVVGAGVIGSATAYVLARAGHQVTVLEALDAPGLGTSFANGGQLSYSHVEPLASPATLRKLPGMLLDADSPLRLRFTGEWAQVRWGLQFLRACRQAQVEVATRSLLALSFLSRDELQRARLAEDLAFAYAQPGKLVLYDNEPALEGARRQVAFQRQFGCEQRVIDLAECLRREPSLAACAPHVKGGVWAPGEAVGDALLLTRQLLMRAQALGAQVRYRTQVTGALAGGGAGRRIEALQTDQGPVSADVFVLANGMDAAALGSRLGLRLGICPIKGYSITLPLKDPSAAPTVSITDLRRKIVYARIGGRLRVAGMAELVGQDLRIDARRIRFLQQCVREAFPGGCDLDADPHPWAGLRPATPTSMPWIGATPIDNLLVNVGHGALGFTLALGSARLIERQLAGAPSAMGAPFAYPGRTISSA